MEPMGRHIKLFHLVFHSRASMPLGGALALPCFCHVLIQCEEKLRADNPYRCRRPARRS